MFGSTKNYLNSELFVFHAKFMLLYFTSNFNPGWKSNLKKQLTCMTIEQKICDLCRHQGVNCGEWVSSLTGLRHPRQWYRRTRPSSCRLIRSSDSRLITTLLLSLLLLLLFQLSLLLLLLMSELPLVPGRVRHPHTSHTVRRPKPTPRPYENPNQVLTSPVENACETSTSCK